MNDKNTLKEIDSLFHLRIKIEDFIRPKQPVQCMKCQNIGHTKNFCHLTPNCIKCGGPHSTTDCKKAKEDDPRCYNCHQTHPANYRRCPAFTPAIQSLHKKTRLQENVIPEPFNFQSLPTTSNRNALINPKPIHPDPQQPIPSTNQPSNSSTSELVTWTLNIIPEIQNLKTNIKDYTTLTSTHLTNNFTYTTKKLVRKEVYRVRNERWNKKVDSLSFENHSLWKMTKSLTSSNTHPTPLLHNNTYFSDPLTKANLHANYLGEVMSAPLISQTKDKHIINHNQALDLQPIDKPDLIEPTEIKMHISSLHNRKAPGIDQITNHTLKITSSIPHLLFLLANLFNACLFSSYFPQKWKLGLESYMG
ncbi:hypothetical protein J437_LFUL017076 [Ladona fulva]|uniref:Pre-C2HC domain-containing protein n=1 Tax=Ladona fulva TaxID=123851 RepID=A0A8K0P8C1_LADFU|nr:hypothetical protein J437_LFUL017076 [Ladona fulva]